MIVYITFVVNIFNYILFIILYAIKMFDSKIYRNIFKMMTIETRVLPIIPRIPGHHLFRKIGHICLVT